MQISFVGTALEAVRAEDAGFEPASVRTPIHLDDIVCLGAESKIEFCDRRQWGKHNCAHFEDAGMCYEKLAFSVLAVSILDYKLTVNSMTTCHFLDKANCLTTFL